MPKVQELRYNGKTISEGDEFKVTSDFNNGRLLEGMIVKAVPYVDDSVFAESKDGYDARNGHLALKYRGRNGEIDFGNAVDVFDALQRGKLKAY